MIRRPRHGNNSVSVLFSLKTELTPIIPLGEAGGRMFLRYLHSQPINSGRTRIRAEQVVLGSLLIPAYRRRGDPRVYGCTYVPFFR